jgi:hypothetical protein
LVGKVHIDGCINGKVLNAAATKQGKQKFNSKGTLLQIYIRKDKTKTINGSKTRQLIPIHVFKLKTYAVKKFKTNR